MRIKFGTFNLFNLVLPDHVFYENRKYSQREYEKKIEWIAQQLAAMKADVVGFQEVFHKSALEAALAKSGLYGNPAIVLNETGESPVVGLASKYPVLSAESIIEFPQQSLVPLGDDTVPLTQFRRPILKAAIELPNGKSIVVFVAHLKSKRPIVEESPQMDSKAEARGKAQALVIRAAEAVALRFILIDEMKNNQTPVVVLGDLNDAGRSVTTEIIAGSPPWKRLSREEKKAIWDQLLYSTADMQARRSFRDVFFTHIFNGHHESLDHVLLSEEFVEANPQRIGRFEYMRVLNDHLLDSTLSNDEIPVWQSDHGQVVVSIKLD
jgi:endonuclease/exonuclease/phosphatase family metal-dependent hydrolase